jgi:hypothetical protein
MIRQLDRQPKCCPCCRHRYRPRPQAKLLSATIRLFADGGTADRGMPFYTVIYGSEDKRP